MADGQHEVLTERIEEAERDLAGVDGEGEVSVEDGGAGDALPVGCAPHEVVRVGDGMAM